MPSNGLREVIEEMGRPQVHPSGDFLGHLIDRMSVHLREAEQSTIQRSEYHRKMAETYATIYRTLKP